MRSAVAVVFLVVASLFAGPITAPLVAQRPDPWRIDIGVNPATSLSEGPTISSENLLSDAKTQEHLRNGFPARLHYRLELWKKGVFDDPVDRAEWDVLVAYDPTAQQYLVRRTSEQHVQEDFGGFATLSAAEAQFGRPFRVGLHPTRAGRYYYNLVIEIQTLTESDLDALQQWLHGRNAPGKAGNPLISLRSGLGTLLSRILGGGSERRQTQSGIFSVP